MSITNLNSLFGFPVSFNSKTKKLKFNDTEKEPDIRLLKQMEKVIYDKEWFLKADKNKELYYMYRGCFKNKEHEKTAEKHKLRYDITILLPTTLGKEFNKTLGHYHPLIKGKTHSYPEMYEVLKGKALYLLQKQKPDTTNEIEDVYFVEAKEGDVVVIPPDYGHITINPSKEPLIMSNWTDSTFHSNYKPIEENHGGAFFVIKPFNIIKNPNYKTPYTPIIKKAKSQFQKNTYSLINDIEKLHFLNTGDIDEL